MELQLKSKTAPSFQETAHMTQRATISVESVVPDSKEDVGRILTLQTQLLLKSKDLVARGATVGGEAELTLITVNENETALSTLKFRQPFSLDYELSEIKGDEELQIRLTMTSSQARLINSRKISAELVVSGELRVFRPVDTVVEYELPELPGASLHALTEERDALLLSTVAEKSFAVHEQLRLPSDKGRPAELLTHRLELSAEQKEVLGERLLLKGNAQLTLAWLSEDCAEPLTIPFALPFSQLIELSEAEACAAEVQIEPNSLYLELSDSIEGEKIVDFELHALAQIRSYRKECVRTVADAYSNAMPCEPCFETLQLREGSEERSAFLRTEESFDMPEGWESLLACFPSIESVGPERAVATLDLLIRGREGRLGVLRRTLTLSGAPELKDCELDSAALTAADLKREGEKLAVRLEIKACGRVCRTGEYRTVKCLTLDEERAFDPASYPALTAVWAETESIWELAKLYHSSPEAIAALNPEPVAEAPLLIPKME
ncbi:MAG: hypothetical protein K6G17_06010 [Oscillospiraceae bacterium]|nr:hypothetical protein [Oscillospiraceae bacterium]